MASLFTAQPLVFETAYSELKRQAQEQAYVLVGSPGSVDEREVKGSTFLYRQFYDARGKKASQYVGSTADPHALGRADELRAAIVRANELLGQSRILARQGYSRADAKTGAIVAALANAGIFRGGGVLVGSHAYGAILNELGIRSAPYSTEDVDLARDRPLALEAEGASFEELLARSTLTLSPILGFDRKSPPTSYMLPGPKKLRVDLLVPARGDEVHVRAVPELRAHGCALPHLGYLLDAPMDAILLSRESVVPVRVPRPERFAWHKMLVSQLRRTTSEKRTKDIHQAAVLFAALEERDAPALREAFDALAPRARSKARHGATLVRDLLEGSHARAAEALEDYLRQWPGTQR